MAHHDTTDAGAQGDDHADEAPFAHPSDVESIRGIDLTVRLPVSIDELTRLAVAQIERDLPRPLVHSVREAGEIELRYRAQIADIIRSWIGPNEHGVGWWIPATGPRWWSFMPRQEAARALGLDERDGWGDGGTEGAIVLLGVATALVAGANAWVTFARNIRAALAGLSRALGRRVPIADAQAVFLAGDAVFLASGDRTLDLAFVAPLAGEDSGFTVGFRADGRLWVAVVDSFGDVQATGTIPVDWVHPRVADGSDI
jgi:hypothetical protein